MQIHENTETKKLSKQEYNRQYYERNKHRWRMNKCESTKARAFKLFSKVSNGPMTPSSNAKWGTLFKRLQILLLITAAIIATVSLVREAANFYLDDHEGLVSAYSKAIMIEGLAILLTFTKYHDRTLRWARRIAVLLFCSFALWVMSGKVIKAASSDTHRVQALQKTLDNLDRALAQKELIAQGYVTRERLTVAKNYEKEIDPIRERREDVQQKIAAEPSPEMIAAKLSISIFYRLLLVLGNLLSIHAVLEYFKYDSTHTEEKKSPSDMRIFLN